MLSGIVIKYFNYIKLFLAKVVSKLELLVSILLILPLPYLLLTITYVLFAINYILLLCDVLYHIYMLLPSIENSFIYNGLLENYHLMAMGDSEFETASKADSNTFLSTSNNTGGNSGGGNTGGSSSGSTFSRPGENVAICVHRDDDRAIIADNADFANHPLMCTYCDKQALNGTPLQQAIVCHACGATICENCNDP